LSYIPVTTERFRPGARSIAHTWSKRRARHRQSKYERAGSTLKEAGCQSPAVFTVKIPASQPLEGFIHVPLKVQEVSCKWQPMAQAFKSVGIGRKHCRQVKQSTDWHQCYWRTSPFV